MGAWGVGLYASDFAQDLRSSIGALLRLPFAPDRLVELLCEREPGAANNAADADHTLFWLVLADQFAKRGVDCSGPRDRALAIIADGDDIKAMAALGMDERSLAKRRAMLTELGARLRAAQPAAKPRKVLKSPQPLLLEVGEAIAYPICKGVPINPYAVGKEWAWVKAWKQDAWGALVVAEHGRAFDFLAWYRGLVVAEPLAARPSLADLWAPRTWLLQRPGTLTARHVKNMQFERLGRVQIDPAALERRFPQRPSPISCAVSDISLANSLSVRGLSAGEADRIRQGRPHRPRIEALAEIAAETSAA